MTAYPRRMRYLCLILFSVAGCAWQSAAPVAHDQVLLLTNHTFPWASRDTPLLCHVEDGALRECKPAPVD